MKPIPVVFHIGPLQIHTYGIGLAIAFWFAYRYFVRRLRRAGYPTDWVATMFFWVVVSAIVGARALHVLSNLGYYRADPGDIFAIWHGGLSSFGGILFAVPVGILIASRRCPQLRLGRAMDLVAPALMAGWALGRLLGPQVEVAGGGHPTTQWFGMYYAGQVGKRLPVPLFQAAEDFGVFCVLLLVERRLKHWPDGTARSGFPSGTMIGVGMVLWGIERFLDEHLWLGEDGHLGSLLVQGAGIALAVGGLVLLVVTRRRWNRWLADGAPPAVADEDEDDRAGDPDEPERQPGPPPELRPGAPGTASLGSSGPGTADPH
jgi:phosphatidylglycerol:prolipoprotein diacylglycerol transferase